MVQEERVKHEHIIGRVISARYLLALLGSCGMGIIYGLKVNLSVAIISMVNHTALNIAYSLENKTESCPLANNHQQEGNYLEDGPFAWPGTLQGTMLSSYFWGYIVAQIPGGRIAEIFSAKWLMFFAIGINILCTILTPFAAKVDYIFMLIMRVCEGIGGGVTFPAMHVMLARWAPLPERTVMSSMVYTGTAIGTVVSTLGSGIIASTLGWESVFYIMGGLSGIWLILWALLIADTPQEQTFIDAAERDYIIESLGQQDVDRKQHLRLVPWKAIFTSPAFIAILISHVCNNWGWYIILIVQPLFFKNVLHFSINDIAFLTSVPFLCMWVYSMLLSKRLDMSRSSGSISTTNARKLATFLSAFIPMLCFALLGFVGCSKTKAILLVFAAVISAGGMFSGFLTNHIDIAPNYAGTLMAITNTAATVPGILVPIVIGKLTQNDPSITSWRIIFAITVCFYLIEILVYTTYGSGDEEPWNRSLINQIESEPLKATIITSYESVNKQDDDDDDDENKEAPN